VHRTGIGGIGHRLIEQYPSYDKLNANIKDEAEKVVKRLRNHPSVVIFAGNNEDYQVAEEKGVIDYSDESGDYMHTKFPA
jgi:beta-mannosidase